MPNDQCLAYYCSGHGYGHATRVSAFTRYLLSIEAERRPLVYIVSSAPQHVFADSISCGAEYRFAEIDPVIVQPLAYRVDRRKSVEVLKKFLSKKDELLEREREWLLQIKATCILSDAAFLGCLAAKASNIPSVLITNFSFDSVYSYLSTALIDATTPAHEHAPSLLDIIPDDPIPAHELAPLVEHIHAGYRCADLLVRLPGHIPIPSFFTCPPLPACDWIDVATRRMKAEVKDCLSLAGDVQSLLPSTPFPSGRLPNERKVIQAPLIVRPPSSGAFVYTPDGRSRLLSSIGVPAHLHDPSRTKILIVSFGGQVFRRPQTPNSRTHSRNSSREDVSKVQHPHPHSSSPSLQAFQEGIRATRFDLQIPSPKGHAESHDEHSAVSPRLATPGHLWIPGAPPASKPPLSPALLPTSQAQYLSMSIPTLNTIPPTPYPETTLRTAFPGGGSNTSTCSSESGSESSEGLLTPDTDVDMDIPRLLPDSSWIAIVCGVSKEQWAKDTDMDSNLPQEFYVAPRDVYMPDLTAVGDVLLGKLGYGTVSECVDACTPFVYVSRPLFVEEHGLRFLLDQEGVGVELSRQSYEAGDWGSAVSEALLRGGEMKAKKRWEMANGVGVGRRDEEGRKLAGEVLDWVERWHSSG